MAKPSSIVPIFWTPVRCQMQGGKVPATEAYQAYAAGRPEPQPTPQVALAGGSGYRQSQLTIHTKVMLKKGIPVY